MALDDWDAQQSICPHCNRPREDCSDPDRAFYPQRSICYATRERVAAQERYAALHEAGSGRIYHDGLERNWSETWTTATPYKYDAGVSVWVADVDLNPDDHFLSRGSAEDGDD